MKKSLAIIPARGGSKRIPGKNIKPFAGQPVIAYPVQAAIQSGLFDEVMVSTDDYEIAGIAKKYGATVPFMRSEKNADDYATTADVLIEVIENYQKISRNFDYVCCLYPVNPFITVEKIKSGYTKLQQGYDLVFSALAYSFPVQRSFRIVEGKVQYLYPENFTKRSQDLEKTYHDAAQFYWFDVVALMAAKSTLLKNAAAIEMLESDAQDIDTMEDWKLAELKFQLIRQGEGK